MKNTDFVDIEELLAKWQEFQKEIEYRNKVYEEAKSNFTAKLAPEVLKVALREGNFDMAVSCVIKYDALLLEKGKQPTRLYIPLLVEKYHHQYLANDIIPHLNYLWKHFETSKFIYFDYEVRVKVIQLIDTYIYFNNFKNYQKDSLNELKSKFNIIEDLEIPSLSFIFNEYLTFKNLVYELEKKDFSTYMKNLPPRKLKEVTDNVFFKWGEPIQEMTKNLKSFEINIKRAIPSESIDFYVFRKIISLTEINKPTILTYLCFGNLFKIVTHSMEKINKSGVYRDLYPLFQITHRTMNEDVYLKSSDYKDFKVYQKDKVETLLGHKKNVAKKQLEKFFNK